MESTVVRGASATRLIVTDFQDDWDMEHKRLRDRFASLRRHGVAIMTASSPVQARPEPAHTHDVLEIFVVRDGAGWTHHGVHRARLTPGTAGIVHLTQAHAVSGGPLVVDNVLLDLSLLPRPSFAELQPALHAILPLHPSIRHCLQPLPLLRPGRERLLRVLDALHDAQRLDDPGQGVLLHCLALALLALLARAAAAEGIAARGRALDTPPSFVERVRAHLHAHPEVGEGLAAMACLAGCAPATLARSFRRYTGESVVRYRQRLCLDRMCAELLATDDRVGDIARRCGLADQAFCNRLFRRRMGVTPSEWRARMRGGGVAADGG